MSTLPVLLLPTTVDEAFDVLLDLAVGPEPHEYPAARAAMRRSEAQRVQTWRFAREAVEHMRPSNTRAVRFARSCAILREAGMLP